MANTTSTRYYIARQDSRDSRPTVDSLQGYNTKAEATKAFKALVKQERTSTKRLQCRVNEMTGNLWHGFSLWPDLDTVAPYTIRVWVTRDLETLEVLPAIQFRGRTGSRLQWLGVA